jgi:hypothetical protein
MAQKDIRDIEKESYYNAIKYGLNSLTSQPGLRNYNVLIRNNVDEAKIDNFIEEVRNKLDEKGVAKDQQYKEISKHLANYVASGNALKNTTRQTLFEEVKDKSFLEKIANLFNPNKLEGEKYFEKARNAYEDMHHILSENKFAQGKMPELVKAAEAMRMYGVLDVALKNFRAHGVMDDKTYKMLSKELQENTKAQSQKGVKGLESYILSQKEEKVPVDIAASIIGFAGILLLLFNLRITGAVIGGDSQITGGIVGVFMLIFALLLFFRPLKRSFKK